MANLEAIGSLTPPDALHRDTAPAVRAQAPDSAQPVDKGEDADKRPHAKRVEAPTRSFTARLNYDETEEEVIIEILDPDTGDVIQRFPAKQIPESLRASVGSAGAFVETFA